MQCHSAVHSSNGALPPLSAKPDSPQLRGRYSDCKRHPCAHARTHQLRHLRLRGHGFILSEGSPCFCEYILLFLRHTRSSHWCTSEHKLLSCERHTWKAPLGRLRRSTCVRASGWRDTEPERAGRFSLLHAASHQTAALSHIAGHVYGSFESPGKADHLLCLCGRLYRLSMCTHCRAARATLLTRNNI
jgi:hypothetical protein